MNINVREMATAAETAESLLRALGHRHRLMIVCQILKEERSVGDLATLMGLRPSTVSQHLALLRKDELVTARRDGQTIWYAVASSPARTLAETLYKIYCSPRTKGQKGGKR